MIRLLTLLLACCAAVGFSAGQAAQSAEGSADWRYTARPGDNLWDLARRFCGSHNRAMELARYNRLADPSELSAGDRLRIPISCLVKQPASATVRVGSEQATLRRGADEQVAITGSEVRMGDVLTTENGFVVVQFADASLLTVRPNSTVMFVLISAYGETGMVDTLVRVSRGRVQHVVDQSTAGSRHRIATPVGIAAVRGTRFRVGVPGGGSATVATTEGVVGFEDAREQSVELPAGTGVVANAKGAVKADLLPAPALDDELRLVRGERLSWPAVEEAVGYRLTVLDGERPLFEVLTVGNDAELALPVGSYTLRVRGVTASGLEGLEAQAILHVSDPPPHGLAALPAGANSVVLSWEDEGDASAYLLEFSPVVDGSWRRLKSAGRRTEVELAPGVYRWRVAHTENQWSEIARFEVAPQPVSSVVTSRDDRSDPLAVAWQHGAQNTTYTVEVSRTADFSDVEATIRTQESSAHLDVRNCQRCFVRVAAETAGATSQYTVAEFKDEPRHPWPLYVLLLALLVTL